MQCKSYSHFFSKKFQHICISLDINFNESLTNDVVSFEQLGPDALCTLCQANNETITHLLWKCDKMQQFITDLFQWLSNYNKHCDISEEVLIFGYKEQKLPKPLNFILLYAKHFIYLSCSKKQPLNLNVFKIKLKYMYKVQAHIATKQNDEEKFQHEWSQYQSLLNDST